MKKLIAATIVVSSLLGLALFGYFGVYRKNFARTNASQDSAQTGSVSLAPGEVKSFRGVLSEVLATIEEKTSQAISEAVPNIFKARTEENSSPNSDSTFTFAVIGDTQRFKSNDPNGNFQKAAARIKALNPDLVFALGDLTGECDSYDACGKDYSDWKNIMGNLMTKTYAAQGNHDRTGENKADKIWQGDFSFPANGPENYEELVYSFNFKNSHFVVLASDNPDEHRINGVQRAWLEQDLASNKQENVFVFFHEPSYPVSSKAGESLDKYPTDRNALWQIFDRYNVAAVFNGHEHIVSRRLIDSKIFSGAKNSIYQIVIGNTDSFDHDLPDPGIAEYSNQGQGRFGIVKVNGKEITAEIHGPDGALLNSFTFSK